MIDVGLLLPLYYHKRNEENMGRLWCITNWQICVIYNNKMIESNDKREEKNGGDGRKFQSTHIGTLYTDA